MHKLLFFVFYILVAISISGCPKKADIIHKEEITFLPKENACIVNLLESYSEVTITDIRDLKINSPFNGFTIYFDTKHSSSDLTVYEPRPGEFIYNIETWLQNDITNNNRTKLNKLMENITVAIRLKCLSKNQAANKALGSDATPRISCALIGAGQLKR